MKLHITGKWHTANNNTTIQHYCQLHSMWQEIIVSVTTVDNGCFWCCSSHQNFSKVMINVLYHDAFITANVITQQTHNLEVSGFIPPFANLFFVSVTHKNTIFKFVLCSIWSSSFIQTHAHKIRVRMYGDEHDHSNTLGY